MSPNSSLALSAAQTFMDHSLVGKFPEVHEWQPLKDLSVRENLFSRVMASFFYVLGNLYRRCHLNRGHLDTWLLVGGFAWDMWQGAPTPGSRETCWKSLPAFPDTSFGVSMGQKYLKCSRKVRQDLVTKQQLSDLGSYWFSEELLCIEAYQCIIYINKTVKKYTQW